MHTFVCFDTLHATFFTTLLLLVAAAVAGREGRSAIQSSKVLRSATHARDLYLGAFNVTCVRPPRTNAFSDGGAAAEAYARLFGDEGGPECFSGEGVRVAVLDTGLCARVAAWSRNDVTCRSLVPGVACEDVGCEHGTRSFSALAGHFTLPAYAVRAGSGESGGATSGTAAFSVSRHHFIGMAPRARVDVFRVFDREGRTHTRYLAAALDALLETAETHRQSRRAKANSSVVDGDVTPPVDVISLSYGGEDYYVNAAVQKRLYALMHSYGVIVVAAAGNDRHRFGRVHSPADMPGVLAVGALQLVGRGETGTHVNASVEKTVASFSGRGCTTWELPFGAGRVKPDVVAVGHRVWSVEGVSHNTTRAVGSRLQLRSVSGTSIAAPVVAGAVALILEAVRWDVAVARPRGDVPTVPRSENVYWRERVESSLRVRQLLMSTAELLTPRPTPTEVGSRSTMPQQPPPTATTTKRAELAGRPLTRLYTRYLALTKWSIFSQGMGEVQPRRALERLLLSSGASATGARRCAAFSLPSSLVVGGAAMGGSVAASSALRGHSAEDLYRWPFSDLMVYPGAVPVLLNTSVYLCPLPDRSDETEGEATYAADFVMRRVTGHDQHSGGKGDIPELLYVYNNSTHSLSGNGLPRLLSRHLLRVVSRLRSVQPALPPTSSLPAVPPTSFTLSTVLFVPPTALTRLRYCTDKQMHVCAMPRSAPAPSGPSTLSVANQTERCGHVCVPLFHAFAGLTVEGEVYVYARHLHNSTAADSRPAALRVPVTVHVRAPPPRVQRVLMDTSLDWLNPTASGSGLFTAGSDPHEAATHNGGSLDALLTSRPAYAAVGGDHPYTNLALLYLYLRQILGLAVSFFPLLRVGVLPLVNGTTSAAAAAEMLSGAGTMVIVDPERPLSRPMRRLLTAAVRPRDGGDGLRVVLVTDWHSAEVAAALRWTREGGIDDDDDSSVLLRAWRYRPENSSTSQSEPGAKKKLRRVEGLQGSCHVASWNRWLDALARDSAESTNNVVVAQGDASETASHRAPFRLSEDIVVDGVLTVAAGGEGHGDHAYRSIGRLNAAGVLRWTKRPFDAPQNASAESPTHNDEGEAVLCNVPAVWSRVQRRLRKHALVVDPASSSSSKNKTQTERDVLYEDMWEMFSEVGHGGAAQEKLSGVRIGGVAALPARPALPPRRAEPSRASLPHGVLGFWTVPRHSQRQHQPHTSSSPGRVAIFTDSNCFSTEDPTLQDALSRLDHLLTSQSAATPLWTTGSSSAAAAAAAAINEDNGALLRLWNSTAGERFLREESAQSSSCVEVMKEMLAWVVTGEGRRWRTSTLLQCEQLTVTPSSHVAGASTLNRSSEVEEDEDDDEDVLHTAPARAEIGAHAVELWAAAVASPRGEDDNDDSKNDRACGECLCLAFNSTRAPFFLVSGENPMSVGEKEHQWRAREEARRAEREVRDALSLSYHGDWVAYAGADSSAMSAPSRVGDVHGNPTSINATSYTPMLRRKDSDALQLPYWIWHPIVLAQAVVCLALVLWLRCW